MSITGLFLILFLTFHMCMNVVALISAEAYNAVCGFLGANWYALVGTLVLAAGFFIHIIYAFWLTMMNRKARGSERYKVVDKPKSVEWASQNMLVLGIIVIGIALFHLYHFWANMQLQEIMGNEVTDVAACAVGACEGISGVVCGTVVPPDTRFLERDAHAGMEQRHLVQPLEGDSQRLQHHHLSGLRRGGNSILLQITLINRFNHDNQGDKRLCLQY